MAWDITSPKTTTKVKDCPAIFQANWDAIDAGNNAEHLTLSGASPGAHQPGECGVLYVGTTEQIGALTSPPACAVAYNTTTSATMYYSGSAWVTMVFEAIYTAGIKYPTIVFDIPGTLATGTNITTSFIMPFTATITKAYAYVRTAPTVADLIIDINKDGTTIWATQGNRLTVTAGQTTATQTSFDTTALVEGSRLDIDIDQVGSSVAGANLTVELKVTCYA